MTPDKLRIPKTCLLPTLPESLIEMTTQDKPRGGKHRDRLTPEGSRFLKQAKEKQ